MGYSANESVYAVATILTTIINLFGNVFSVAIYVLGALGLYSIAKRRKLNRPWLAWIPVAQAWIIGSLSDQYRYVKHGQVKNKRKWLLALECLTIIVVLITVVLVIVNVVGLVTAGPMSEDAYAVAALSIALQFMLLWLGAMAAVIARAIIHFMAMYDIYTSLNPAYNVVFLLVSIFFNVTEPFFLFFNRNKDMGMPPRNDAPPVTYVEEA